MAVRAKVDKHLNLYKNDVEDFEELYGTEHGIFSRLTREMFHTYMEKARGGGAKKVEDDMLTGR